MSGNTLIQISGDHKPYLIISIFFFMTTTFLLMWLAISVASTTDNLKETKTEVRILQMHMQDQNAILIREGITRAGDYSTGPTNPDKLRVGTK